MIDKNEADEGEVDYLVKVGMQFFMLMRLYYLTFRASICNRVREKFMQGCNTNRAPRGAILQED